MRLPRRVRLELRRVAGPWWWVRWMWLGRHWSADDPMLQPGIFVLAVGRLAVVLRWR